MKIEELIATNSAIVENSLEKYMQVNGYGLENPMKYSLLSGGKRLRPFIVLEAYKLFSKKNDIEKAIPFACALEMIHTYSLIHDDLPCMDNDDYRRGKPTNHKIYGEANALLAGDSLLTYAFYVMSNNDLVSDKCVRYAIKELSWLSGFGGMAGGQMLDINCHVNSYKELEKMHSLKTGALIKCAVLLGYYASCEEPNEEIVEDLSKFAMNIGIAFQIRDDILDKIADESVLGKPVGSDEKNNKLTSLSYMTIQEAQEKVDSLTEEAIKIITKYSNGQESSLSSLAKYLVERNK
ncbi:MAG: polyprenyl synthetase family protein [Clostridia bacterium]|nr:polyprenyl synthetase family protein [Clostridia bacterium]